MQSFLFSLILPPSLSWSLCSSGFSKGELIKPVPHPTSWPACEKQYLWSKTYTCTIRTANCNLKLDTHTHTHNNWVEPHHFTPHTNITEIITGAKLCMSTSQRSRANRSGWILPCESVLNILGSNMHVCSLLTEDIGGMSFLGNGFDFIVAPAVLPVAVPCVFHHLRGKKG